MWSFACSGSLQVLQLPSTVQRHAVSGVRLISDSKLAVDVSLMVVSLSLLAVQQLSNYVQGVTLYLSLCDSWKVLRCIVLLVIFSFFLFFYGVEISGETKN